MLNSNAAKPFAGVLCSSCLLPSSPQSADAIPCLQLSSCLPQPGGHSQPLLLSFSAPHLTVFLSVVALPRISRQSAFLQSLPISAALLAGPHCCSPTRSLSAHTAVFGGAGGNQTTAALLGLPARFGGHAEEAKGLIRDLCTWACFCREGWGGLAG